MHVPVRVECTHIPESRSRNNSLISINWGDCKRATHPGGWCRFKDGVSSGCVCRLSNYLGNLELSKNLCLMQTNKSFIEFRTKKWMNTAWGGASPSAGWCLLNVSVGGWVVMLWSPLPFPCNLPRCDAPLCLTPRWPPSRPASLLSWALPGPQLLTRVKEKKKKYIYIYMPLYVLLYKSIKKEYREI